MRNDSKQYVYDAFGNQTVKEEMVPNRFGFTGEICDGLTGQYYLRARFYNPVIGRFLNEDTYYGDGLNLYSYCRNNPVRYVDPSGHSCEGKEGKKVHEENGEAEKNLEIGMYRKKKDHSAIEPMPKRQLQKIVKAYKQQGGIIQMNAETDAYLQSKMAEAITLNENTILLRQKPGRASVFEELIHATQYREGLNDGSVRSRIENEIAAQKKLLENSKAYKLTPAEIKQTKSALASYIKELDELIGGK